MMRAIVLLLTALMLSCGPAPQPAEAPGPSPEDDRAALMSADAAWSRTVGDTEATLAYFAEGARMLAPEVPAAQGPEALRAAVEEMQGLPNFSLGWTATGADASGDMGYTVGTFELTAGEEPVTRTGNYTTIWRRQSDGSWKVVVDAWNFDAPLPAQ